MPPVDWLLLPLLANFALGGVVLAVLLLAVEFRMSRLAPRCTLWAGAGLLIAGIVLFVARLGLELSIPAVALGVAALGAAVVRLEATRQVVLRFVHPAAVWGAVLIIGFAGGLYAQFASVLPGDENEIPIPAATNVHMLEGLVAVTDLGREIPLCTYNPSESLLEEERGILGLEQYRNQVIRLVEPRSDCNCHGWVYTSGKYAIRGRDVDTILADNGYSAVPTPQAGDLAIYRGGGEEVTHTGLVRLVTEAGAVFIESKWGPLGVYLHPVGSQPYGPNHTYYRSGRAGHLVTLQSPSGVPASHDILADAGNGLPADADILLSAWRGRSLKRPAYERPMIKVPGQRKT